jgi:hypothetical protein
LRYDSGTLSHSSEEDHAMARIFINHPVSDYDKWRPAFDADKPRRAAAGMFQDPELGKLTEEAGVTAPPEVWVA